MGPRGPKPKALSTELARAVNIHILLGCVRVRFHFESGSLIRKSHFVAPDKNYAGKAFKGSVDGLPLALGSAGFKSMSHVTCTQSNVGSVGVLR